LLRLEKKERLESEQKLNQKIQECWAAKPTPVRWDAV
jgi:hypothetical protein